MQGDLEYILVKRYGKDPKHLDYDLFWVSTKHLSENANYVDAQKYSIERYTIYHYSIMKYSIKWWSNYLKISKTWCLGDIQ